MRDLNCFKAYDIRGRLGPDLDAGIARRIGAAFAQELGARRVVLGRDVRASSNELAEAVAEGLMSCGAEVLDLGLCGTEEVYCATALQEACGGIMVTASHNPIDWNGMKLVARGSAPLSPETLGAIRRRAEALAEVPPPAGGAARRALPEARAAYVARVLSFADPATLGPLHIVADAGNGAAGPSFDAIAAALEAAGAKLRITRIHHDPDPRFPNGFRNPFLPGNRHATAEAVRKAGADLGLAWDGDFDRCFFFDHTGAFIDGEYLVALLAEAFLARDPGAAIVHDPRVVLATTATVARAGGRAVQSRTGHAFLKQAMRDTGAVYGGEMSAHHYFRDFFCCDSGMIPWLLVAGLIGRKGKPLADLVGQLRADYPSSGEINFRLDDPAGAVARVEAHFAPQALSRDDADGLSLTFAEWRFNLRSSNTEPLLRLNVEARGDADLVARRVAELGALIGVPPASDH